MTDSYSEWMEFRALEIFVEVVRQGGFTAASHKVFLTQPSISRVIRQLEDEFGQVLLERTRREIILTDAGRIVYERAVQIQSEGARLRSELADLAELRHGELNLGIPPLGGTLFVPLVRKFKELFPAIELRLFEKGSKASATALLEGELDLGTLLLPTNSELFETIPCVRDRLALVVPRGSAWSAAAPVPLSALKDQPIIFFPAEFALNERILSACREAGFEPAVAGRSGQARFIEGLVDSGVGVALLPTSVLKGLTMVETVELAPPGVAWEIGLAHLRNSYLSYAARAFLQLASKNPIK